MNNAEIRELAVVVTDVYELYGRECSDGVHRLWWEALKGYAMGEVRQAFSRHVTNPDGGQFVPKPADILKILNGGGETRALQAWTQVDQAVRRIGPWESVVFDDALIHAVIADMGGWVRFGQTTDDEWPFVRNVCHTCPLLLKRGPSAHGLAVGNPHMVFHMDAGVIAPLFRVDDVEFTRLRQGIGKIQQPEAGDIDSRDVSVL